VPLRAPLAQLLLVGAAYAGCYLGMLALAGLLPEARALFARRAPILAHSAD
jgi:hypothetical protein